MASKSDKFSGNMIRKTDNDLRSVDVTSPQDPAVLELDPETGLPTWWERMKEKEARNDDGRPAR